MLVTVRDGYAFRLDLNAVDAWRFGVVVTRAVGATPNQAEPLFSTALRDWRGAAFHEFAERPRALPKVKRLTGLRRMRLPPNPGLNDRSRARLLAT